MGWGDGMGWDRAEKTLRSCLLDLLLLLYKPSALVRISRLVQI